MSFLSKLADVLPTRIGELVDSYELYKGIRDNLPKVAAAAVVLVVCEKAARYSYIRHQLKRKRQAAQEEIKSAKLEWKNIVTSDERITLEETERITSMKFDDLVTSLRKGDLKAVTVLRAFQRKAAIEDERCNFICVPIDADDAEEIAEELDSIPVAERASKLLFGLPLSVKENEDIMGYCATMGCTRKLGVLAECDSPRVKVLTDLGAIPFITTNVPQALLSFSCENPIYGVTKSPWDTRREPGGSSGGEGAAIASGASVLGLGSDIGGSVRIPAAWNGIPGIKPTVGRLSSKGRHAVNPGQNMVPSTAGPMASTVEGLIMAIRSFSSKQMFCEDPSIPQQLFNDEELDSQRPLTIGVYYTAGPVEICAAAKRAVKEAADHLAAKGHKIVPYELRDVGLCSTKYFPTAVFADGGAHLCRMLYGDEISKDISPMYTLLRLPITLKKLLNRLLKLMLPKYVADVVKRNEGVASLDEWCILQRQLQQYIHAVIFDWRDQGIDAVICPAMPVPAMPLGDPALAKAVVAYTIPWNVLNFPAGVVPVTRVTSRDEADDLANFPAKDLFHKIMKRGLVGSEGLPMAAQLVTLPFQEELCLRLMKELESAAAFQPLVRPLDQ